MKLQKLNTDSDYFFRENFLLQFESQERKEKGSKWCFSSFAKNLYIIFFQYFAWDYYVKAGNSLWRFLGKYLVLGFSGQKGPKWTQSKVLRSKLLLWFSLEKSCTRVLGSIGLSRVIANGCNEFFLILSIKLQQHKSRRLGEIFWQNLWFGFFLANRAQTGPQWGEYRKSKHD